jgi:hypothetical protein
MTLLNLPIVLVDFPAHDASVFNIFQNTLLLTLIQAKEHNYTIRKKHYLSNVVYERCCVV